MARIKTTPTARVALWAIRIYLLILLTLIGVKFVRVFRNAPKPPDPAIHAPVNPPLSGIKP
jgi:hypothetical protein